MPRLALRSALPGVFAATLLLAACSPPSSDTADTESADDTGAITAAVTVEDVAALGDITLDVWAEAGEEQTLEKFVPAYEAKYPNVTVNVTTKSIDDLVTTVVNAMAGENPPDVAQGNQGYGVDGALVEAGLLMDLEPLDAIYGWSDTIGQNLLGPMRWTDGGQQFRDGNLYALSPVANNVGVFYNKDVLDKAGVGVPTTWAEFEAALAAVKQAGELPILLGNAEKWPALHVFGVVQGAYVDPAEVNAWVAGVEGSTFDTEGNRMAADTMVRWAKAGYFGNAYNGVGADDAAAAFGQGKAAFHLAGDWYAPAIIEGGKGDFGFMPPPPGDSGKVASTGSLSFPWHISAKTDAEAAAVAFVAMMHDPANSQLLVDVNRIPVMGAEVNAPEGMASDLIATNEALMAADGQMDYQDWSTPTMYDTMPSAMQELMAGKISTDEFIQTVQADWDEFQASR